MIEIKEFPIEGLIDDIPDGDDIGEFLLNMDNNNFDRCSCLMYYEFPSHNQEGIQSLYNTNGQDIKLQ